MDDIAGWPDKPPSGGAWNPLSERHNEECDGREEPDARSPPPKLVSICPEEEF